MKQDDFKYRYIVKVLSSIGIAVLNMIIQFVLPRAFNIEEYGYYTYNLNVFTSIVTLANLSASNAFIAKYSKRNQEIGMIYFYLSFYGIVAIVLNVSVIFLYGIGAFSSTFAGQTLGIVMLGLETAIVLKLLTDCISIYDAAAIPCSTTNSFKNYRQWSGDFWLSFWKFKSSTFLYNSIKCYDSDSMYFIICNYKRAEKEIHKLRKKIF
mgnify:CR=1 FL=1